MEYLTSQNDIAEFIKMKKFDEKKKNNNNKINNSVTSNKARHKETEKKLNDHITSYIKLINDLSGELKVL